MPWVHQVIKNESLLGYPSNSISTCRSTNPLFPGDIKVGNKWLCKELVKHQYVLMSFE